MLIIYEYMRLFLSKINKLQLCCIFFIMASTFALSSVYILQYGFDKPPCELCMYQRVPYFVIFPLSLLFLLIMRIRKFILCAMFLSYFAGSVIAFYHMELDLDIFPNILSGEKHEFNYRLDRDNDGDFDSKDLSIMISGGKASHGENQFLFNFPIAGWNFIYSTACLFIVILIHSKYDKWREYWKKKIATLKN